MKTVALELHDNEHSALCKSAATLRIKPEELLWYGLDGTMQTIARKGEGIEDEDAAYGVIEDTHRRFDKGELPQWAGSEQTAPESAQPKAAPLTVDLSAAELAAVASYARDLRLTPQELAFAAINHIMGSGQDDPDMNDAYTISALDRYKFKQVPEWANSDQQNNQREGSPL